MSPHSRRSGSTWPLSGQRRACRKNGEHGRPAGRAEQAGIRRRDAGLTLAQAGGFCAGRDYLTYASPPQGGIRRRSTRTSAGTVDALAAARSCSSRTKEPDWLRRTATRSTDIPATKGFWPDVPRARYQCPQRRGRRSSTCFTALPPDAERTEPRDQPPVRPCRAGADAPYHGGTAMTRTVRKIAGSVRHRRSCCTAAARGCACLFGLRRERRRYLAPQCTALALLAAIMFPCAAHRRAEMPDRGRAGMTALHWGCRGPAAEYAALRLIQPAGRVRRGHGAAGGGANTAGVRCARISRRCGEKQSALAAKSSFLILAAVCLILRTGDGCCPSVGEQRVRNPADLLLRPRYDDSAKRYTQVPPDGGVRLSASARSALPPFPKFCHIRAHSLLRTGIGPCSASCFGARSCCWILRAFLRMILHDPAAAAIRTRSLSSSWRSDGHPGPSGPARYEQHDHIAAAFCRIRRCVRARVCDLVAQKVYGMPSPPAPSCSSDTASPASSSATRASSTTLTNFVRVVQMPLVRAVLHLVSAGEQQVLPRV